MKHTLTIILISVAATIALAEEPAHSSSPSATENLISSAQATQVKAGDMMAASQKRLKENQARTDALFKREEDLVARSEASAARYEMILSTREKQQTQFQAYLDSLTK